MIVLPIALAAALLSLAPTARSQDAPDGWLETFALAPDRSEALGTLLPGSEDAAYYRCLHAQNSGDLETAARLLAARSKRPQTSRWLALATRQTLLAFDPASADSWAALIELIGPRLDHRANAPNAARELPSILDPALLTQEAWRERAFGRSADLKRVRDTGLAGLVGAQLSPHQRAELLDRLPRPDVPGLVELVAADLQDPRSEGFGSRGVHGRLLLDQLEELAAALPELRGDTGYQHALLRRMRPGDDVNLRRDRAARGAYLERLLAFTAELPSSANSLRAHVLYHALEHDLARDIVQEPRLLEYLAIPRSRGYASPHAAPARSQANLGEAPPTGLPAVGSDRELIRAYLERVLADLDDWGAYLAFFPAQELDALVAAAKLLAGAPDPERWYRLLGGPLPFAELEERVELAFAPHNPREFAEQDAVALDLFVKNAGQLIVQVYALEPLNWHLANDARIPDDIDLSGLVPTWSRSLRFDEPKIRRVRRRFDLPAIDRPGTYVVEVVGSGQSSRAIVRKGGLDFVEHQDAAGHVLHVTDGAGNHLPAASVWADGVEHTADDTGAIRLPFRAEAGTTTLVLAHGSQAVRTSFAHRAESYALRLGLLSPRESLIGGKDTRLVLRPRLFVADQPTRVGWLSDPLLELQIEDHRGRKSTQVIQPGQLPGDAELTVPLSLPEGWRRLSLRLSAWVQHMSTGERRSVRSAWQTMAGPQILATTDIGAPLLRRVPGGYVLEVRGRSGEPLAGEALHVGLHHRDYDGEFFEHLQTGADGRIQLGPLDGIVRLSTDGFAGKRRSWDLDPDDRSTASQGRHLHLVAGQGLSLRAPGGSGPVAGSMEARGVSLLEVRSGVFVRDAAEALEFRPGTLNIRGLEPGDYALAWRATGVSQRLRVSAGPSVAGWALGAARKLELAPHPALRVSSLEARDDAVVLRLAGHGPGTRVHAFATHLMPGSDLVPRFEAGPLPDLRRALRLDEPTRYRDSQRLSNEQRYVLERRFRTTFPGNMLSAKPGLLLNVWEARDTHSTQPMGGGIGGGSGGDFGGRFGNKQRSTRPARFPREAEAGLYPDPGFLRAPIPVLANLRPGADGALRIPRASLGAGQHVVVIAADAMRVVRRDLVLPERGLEPRDLRLAAPLNPGDRHALRRRFLSVQAGDTVSVERTADSRVQWTDSLAGAHALLRTLSGNENLDRFAFLTKWPSHSPERKAELYSEYACHELHVFLRRKDPAFFESVVRPYLANKGERTFFDRWLLDSDLSADLEPHAFAKRNALERILLGTRVAGAQNPVLRWARDGAAARHISAAGRTELFERALALSGAEALARRSNAMGSAPASSVAPAPSPEGADGPGAPGPETLQDSAKESASDDFFLGRGQQEQRGRSAYKPRWRTPGTTKAFVERHYWELPIHAQSPALIALNPFWLDLAEHLALDPSQRGPFVSAHLPRAAGSLAEMLLALAFLDLPFDPPEHEDLSTDQTWSRVARGPALVLAKELAPVPPSDQPLPLALTQDLVRLDDRFETVNGRRRDKLAGDELQAGCAYALRVTITNPTPANLDVQVLLQIPAGAVALDGAGATRALARDLTARSSAQCEIEFYFPSAGTFPLAPAQVNLDGAPQIAADPRTFVVRPGAPPADPKAWATVAAEGTRDEVLASLAERSLFETSLAPLYWRLGDSDFYAALIEHLRGRLHYDAVVWSYGLLHRDTEAAADVLRRAPHVVDSLGGYLRSPLLYLDPFESGALEHVELSPLIPSRAHPFGPQAPIQNSALRDQWNRLLGVLARKTSLESPDHLALASYLVLQGRIAEAIEHHASVDPSRLVTRLQYDYLSAYLAFFGDDPEVARAVAAPYMDHPVTRWRARFREVIAHLDEAAGAAPVVTDPESLDQRQGALASADVQLDLEVIGERLVLTAAGTDRAELRFYEMDIEQLFSSHPFLEGERSGTAYVRPKAQETWELEPGTSRHERALPAAFVGHNTLVEVRGGGQITRSLALSGALDLRLSRAYGQLQLLAKDTGRPVRGAYVKVFRRDAQREVAFHKDGATDLRGRFDYASITGHQGASAERFAILVLTPSGAAVVREVEAPLQ